MKGHRLYVSTKRRRQVYLKKMLLCFIAMVIIAGLSIGVCSNFAAAHNNTADSPIEHKYYKSIELSYGDTLWDIAEEYISDEYTSIYDYINELKQINNLHSDDIHANRYLTVVYYDI